MIFNSANSKVGKMKKIIEKIFTKEIMLYIIFGVLTTLVNLITFFFLNVKFKVNENIANLIAIILAVLFAYITNRSMVFHSEAKGMKEKIKEFFKFIFGRALTMFLEFAGGFLLFKIPIPKIITKAILTVIVIILNFFISKFYAFKNK